MVLADSLKAEYQNFLVPQIVLETSRPSSDNEHILFSKILQRPWITEPFDQKSVNPINPSLPSSFFSLWPQNGGLVTYQWVSGAISQ